MVNSRGIYTWANGGRYEGNFKKGKESGRGVKTWANGNKYDGEYKDGKKHGRGVFTWTEEGRVGPYLRYANVCMPPMRVASYEGEYKNGTMDGRCVFYGVDGTKYEGESREGRGVLIFTWADGGQFVIVLTEKKTGRASSSARPSVKATHRAPL